MCNIGFNYPLGVFVTVNMDLEPTREKVLRALETLMADIPLQKITVGRISAEAGISRQTFYYHFDNIFDIFRWSLKSEMRMHTPYRNVPSFLGTVDGLYRSLEKNRNLTLAFSRTPYMVDIIGFIREELTPAARRTISYRVPYNISPMDLDICTTFLVGGNVNLFATWLENSMEPSVEEIYLAGERLMNVIFDPKVVRMIVNSQQAPVFHRYSRTGAFRAPILLS